MHDYHVALPDESGKNPGEGMLMQSEVRPDSAGDFVAGHRRA
jgi:hypothetical protein